MRNKLILIVIVAVLFFVVLSHYKKEIRYTDISVGEVVASAKFICNNGKSIEASFASDAVTLRFDGRNESYTYPQVISASGARYANEDESFVFWNKGNTAFVEQNGVATYENCIEEE